MPNRFSPGCRCCAGGGDCDAPVSVCFHVAGCAGANVKAAVVTLDDGAGHVYSAATDAGGNACLGVLRAAAYTYSVSKTGYNTASGPYPVVCGSTPMTSNVTPAPAAGWTCRFNCCNEHAPVRPGGPPPLHLTTAGGSFLLPSNGGCLGPLASGSVIGCNQQEVFVKSGFTPLMSGGWSCPGQSGKLTLGLTLPLVGPIAGFTPKYLWGEYDDLPAGACATKPRTCCSLCGGGIYGVVCDFFGTCTDGAVNMTATLPASFTINPGGFTIPNPLGTALTLTS